MDKQQYKSTVAKIPTTGDENKSPSPYHTIPEYPQAVVPNATGEEDSDYKQVQPTMGGSSMFCPPHASGYISYPNYTTMQYPSSSSVFHSLPSQYPTM